MDFLEPLHLSCTFNCRVFFALCTYPVFLCAARCSPCALLQRGVHCTFLCTSDNSWRCSLARLGAVTSADIIELRKKDWAKLFCDKNSDKRKIQCVIGKEFSFTFCKSIGWLLGGFLSGSLTNLKVGRRTWLGGNSPIASNKEVNEFIANFIMN